MIDDDDDSDDDGDDDGILLLKHMLQDAQAMIDRLVDLTRHVHPGIRLNAVWALMVHYSFH